MSQTWIYTVGANSHPDKVDCCVPWRVDEQLVFFGPCKKRMRKKLRDKYLSDDRHHCTINDETYIVGVNSGNRQQIRKIIWAGKLCEVMTFAFANDRGLKHTIFKALRNHESSPLHVEPIHSNGQLVGYKHRSELHKDNHDWVADLTSNSAGIRREGRKIMIRANTYATEVFDRDCCMLLENIFCAHGEGIEFDKEVISILKKAQPNKPDIDKYAIFGYNANGDVNGLRGSWLEIMEPQSRQFVEWLTNASSGRSVTEAGKLHGSFAHKNCADSSHNRRPKSLCQ